MFNPNRPTRPILRGVVVAVAGDLGPGWTDTDVARWLTYHSGRFCPDLDDRRVTHVLCTEKARKRLEIVAKDWLEDSLHQGRRLSEKPYRLATLQREREEAIRRESVQRDPVLVQTATFVDETLYRVYRDTTGFAYQVTLTRDHPESHLKGERYVLYLFESYARPPLFWFAARHYKSHNHSRPVDIRPSNTCQTFATEFAHFCALFKRKTGISWDARLVGTGSADHFQYKKPAKGEPMGIIMNLANVPEEEEEGDQTE